jgi:DNA-binding MarR family transcriptional regulator
MATDLELSKSRICRLVESLRRKKIVTKVENDKDHRYNNIKLTKKGTDVRDSFLNDRLQRCLTIITPIDDSKLDTLIPLLNMLQDEFTRYKEELKKAK